MFRYLVQLPFMLKFGDEQTFPIIFSEKKVTLKFLNPKRIAIPSPYPIVTALGIDTDNLLSPDDLEKIRVYFNNIIRAYRLMTQETYNNGNIIQISQDQFLQLIVYGEVDENDIISKPRLIQYVKKLEMGTVSKDMYGEIARLANSVNLIKECSNNEILLQAKSFFEQENYRMAVLEAVIALEITVSSLIRKKAEELEISKKEIGELLKIEGLTCCLETVLPMLFSRDLPSRDLLVKLKSAISIRNAIVHKGRSSISSKEAQDAIIKIEEFVNKAKGVISKNE
jgi:uncharacterized protein (UPF0332 family)